MTISAEDRVAINEILAKHGHLADACALGAGVACWDPAIRRAALALGEANPVRHHVTNLTLSEEGDAVRATSKAIGVRADGSAGSLVYEDLLRREDEGWRIAYRRIELRRAPMGRERY